MTRHTESQSVLERNARAAFDASVEGLDASTRSRLNQARQAATAELERRRRVRWMSWAPATALAAVALVAVLVWRTPGPGTEVPQAQAQAAAAQAAEVLAADDDLDLASEDLAFYEWVGDQADGAGNSIG